MRKSHQSGFAAIETVLILVIIAMIAGTGYYVWHAKQNADKSLNSSAGSNQTIAKSTTNNRGVLKSYTDPVGNFSFSYSGSWTLNKKIENTDPQTASSVVTLKSPDGKATVHFGADHGGKGGDCEPAATDKPFQSGNTCNTIEFLSSEQLGIKNVYYGKEHQDSKGNFTYTYEPTNVILVTYHFADGSGKQSYGIGVTNSNPNNPIATNSPYMGLVTDMEFVDVYDAKGTFKPYVYAYATGPDQRFLEGSNSDTIKTIFKSLTIKN